MASLGVMVMPYVLFGQRKNYSLKYQWKILTEKQKEVRDRSYVSGLPRYPKTLTAIAWQESSFGLPSKMENPKDPSGGVFGNSYVTVARRHFRLGQEVSTSNGIVDATSHVQYVMPSSTQRGYVRRRLKTDFSFDVYHALRTLAEGHFITELETYVLLGRRFRSQDWLGVWSYYNGGAKGSPKYAEEIRKKVAFMEAINYQGDLT